MMSVPSPYAGMTDPVIQLRGNLMLSPRVVPAGTAVVLELADRSLEGVWVSPKSPSRSGLGGYVCYNWRNAEGAHNLFFFEEYVDRLLFERLIEVKGVSLRLAVEMMTKLTGNEIVSHVTAGNADALSEVKGIGGKVAAAVIADLRKVYGKAGPQADTDEVKKMKAAAVSAMVAMGHKAAEAKPLVASVYKDAVDRGEPYTAEGDLLRACFKAHAKSNAQKLGRTGGG